MSLYKNNIPQPGDRPSTSQGQILDNFSQLDMQYGTAGDHVAFSATTLNGTHNKVTLNQQGSDQATVANQVCIYPKTLTTNSVAQPELYLRQQSNASTPILMTRGSPNPNSGEGVAYGGVQIRCGIASTGTNPQSFSTPFATACIAVVACPNNTGSQVNITAKNATNFSAAANPSGTVSYYYIAIGY